MIAFELNALGTIQLRKKKQYTWNYRRREVKDVDNELYKLPAANSQNTAAVVCTDT